MSRPPTRVTSSWGLGTVIIALTEYCITAFCGSALAQITSDGTLGPERSIVKSNVNTKGSPADRIVGGATRGANLFHSFQEFNVRNGQRVYFANPTGIKNILGRVTGENGSDIQGTLGVLSKANLFLINPNGIIFGENARLDVKGSFVASTADSVLFDNNLAFEATSNANGGNINIKGTANRYIIPTPREDSDIIATADEGQGGNIEIEAQGIFGIKEWEGTSGNGTNDIDASSESSV